MFIQTFMKYHYLGGDIVRFEGSAKYPKGGVREKFAMINNPEQGSQIEVKLYDGRTFEVKESATATVYAGDPKKGSKPVNVQFLGDSFTRGCYFKEVFLERGLVPYVKLVGTRTVSDFKEQCHEGRGGWTVGHYFSNRTDGHTFHNPYYQPTGDIRYWGTTAFWESAVKCSNGVKGLDSNTRYNCGDYNTERFNDKGFLASPKVGDVMFNSSKESYVKWSGKKWESIEEPKEWEFDYAKYLTMWEFDKPDFLVVMLGLNDFSKATLPIDFTKWNSMVEKLLASYRAAVPHGRLIFTTPCTSSGTLENENGTFTIRQNTVMWHVRENIISTFDGREEDGIYVVDASVTIDNENGYNLNKAGLQSGNQHPYPNYPKLGAPIAACIQYYREK